MPIFPEGTAPIFPDGGGSGGPGLNAATVYCSPDGSDNNDGSSWQLAKRTGYAAAEYLIDNVGGGIVAFADATPWGGPVAGQGLWFRGDSLEVPGFLGVVPLQFVGYGSQNGGVFMPGTSASFIGCNG